MVIFYKWKKYNEIPLTKNKMDLNIRKMTNHPPSPRYKRKSKVKSSIAKSPPVENLLPQNQGSIINYLQYYTEVAQWRTPSCRQPQPATDNGVKDGRSN